MRRILLVLAAVTLVAACNTMPAAVPLPAPAQIETGLLSAANPPHRMTLAGRMRHHKVPGVSIAVIDMGRLAWVRAYGDTQAGGVPVTTFRKDDAEYARAMKHRPDLDRDRDGIACEKR